MPTTRQTIVAVAVLALLLVPSMFSAKGPPRAVDQLQGLWRIEGGGTMGGESYIGVVGNTICTALQFPAPTVADPCGRSYAPFTLKGSTMIITRPNGTIERWQFRRINAKRMTLKSPSVKKPYRLVKTTIKPPAVIEPTSDRGPSIAELQGVWYPETSYDAMHYHQHGIEFKEKTVCLRDSPNDPCTTFDPIVLHGNMLTMLLSGQDLIVHVRLDEEGRLEIDAGRGQYPEAKYLFVKSATGAPVPLKPKRPVRTLTPMDSALQGVWQLQQDFLYYERSWEGWEPGEPEPPESGYRPNDSGEPKDYQYIAFQNDRVCTHMQPTDPAVCSYPSLPAGTVAPHLPFTIDGNTISISNAMGEQWGAMVIEGNQLTFTVSTFGKLRGKRVYSKTNRIQSVQ